MKRFINILITLSLLTLASCSFFGKEDLIELGANGKVNLQLTINDYEGATSEARTILPSQEDGTEVSKYVLDGTLQGSDETLNKVWNSYSSMINDTLEVTQGTWYFTLSAYKSEDGTDKLFAKGTVTKALSITQMETLAFNLSFAANTLQKGSLAVKVNVPSGLVRKANVSIYSYISSSKNEVVNRDYFPTNGNAGNSTILIEESDIPNDFYYLQMEFYTDASTNPTAIRIQNVKIAGGQTSRATISYSDDLNKNYTIIFNPQLPSTETYSIPYTELGYNSSTKITLPGSSDCTADHYDFAGWYDNSSYTGSAITDWAAGERTGEVNLFAKWTPRAYPVSYYDFAGGQATGKTYSGTPMASTLGYNITIPEPTYDTANGALTDGNEVIFAGWYTDKDCTAASKITEYDGSADLYAKWNYINYI